MAVGMAYKNIANRQVCDISISHLSGKPFLYFNTANTTSFNIQSDQVFAMAKGTHKIMFPGAMNGTITISAQVYTSKLYELLSDGRFYNGACYARTDTIKCVRNNKLPLVIDGGTIKDNEVFAYPKDSFGDQDSLISCSFANNELTGNFTVGQEYRVGYIIIRTTNTKTYTFRNRTPLNEYRITMTTITKDEDGSYSPFVIVFYRAILNREFELSFSSEGDPAELSFTFTILSDRYDRFMDMYEIGELKNMDADDIELPYYIIITDDNAGNATVLSATKPDDPKLIYYDVVSSESDGNVTLSFVKRVS